MKTKSNYKVIIILVLIMIIIDILFFPVLMNKILSPLLTGENLCESLGILYWTACFATIDRIKITAGFEIMIFSLCASLLTQQNKKTLTHNNEHGSASLLTDKKFNDILPSYIFYKDKCK